MHLPMVRRGLPRPLSRAAIDDYTEQPERFVRKPPEPSALPAAV